MRGILEMVDVAGKYLTWFRKPGWGASGGWGVFLDVFSGVSVRGVSNGRPAAAVWARVNRRIVGSSPRRLPNPDHRQNLGNRLLVGR